MDRPFTLCHTSDWHLGHTLHGHSREPEHRRFLEFLLEVLERERVDALIVAGDVFDTGNPPASAQAMYYGFLADARRRLPTLDVLIVAGNHDSASRLSAPDPVLRALGVRVVGTVPRLESPERAELDAEALVVPLRRGGGEVAAWVAAVPFLRPSDLPVSGLGQDRLPGVRRLYEAVLDRARARRGDGQALLATGHCHMVGSATSAESERVILGGLDQAYPVDLFDADVAYAALGHLHLAQAVGDHEHVRYSGSPLPLSMSETRYPHQVRIARFEAGRLIGQDAVLVPRTVALRRVPSSGSKPLEEVLAELRQLELPDAPPELHPFLEVRVRLTEPVPDVRQQVEAALSGRPVRLVKLTVEHAGTNAALAEATPRHDLSDLGVEEVFRRCYAREFEGDPSEALLGAFREVADAARRQVEEGER